MYNQLFSEFQLSDDTLRVYKDERLIFSSCKDRLLPLLEYIDSLAPQNKSVVIFDKITGNAAALLSVKAGSKEVYSPLGSQLATQTLEKYAVKHQITEIIPFIQAPNGKDICPMEKLSIDKEPDEFYEALKKLAKERKK